MKIARTTLFYFCLALIACSIAFPLLWFLSLAFKEAKLTFTVPPTLISRPTLSAFRDVFTKGSSSQNLFNSLIVACATTVLSILAALPAAYGFARFRFKRSQDLLFWILSLRMAPAIAVVIPYYLLMRDLHLLGSYASLIIIYLSFNIPLTVWMMKGAIEEVPAELDESARIDGCSRLGAFFRIVLPLTSSGLVVTAVLCFIYSWNEFLFALVLTTNRTQTLPVAAVGFWTNVLLEWNKIAAISFVCLIPPLALSLLFRKYIVRGLTLGAIK